MNIEVISREENLLVLSVDGETKTTSKTTDSNCCRDVRIFDNFVVKFEGEDYYKQNENEIKFYQTLLLPSESHFFAKLLAHGTTENGDSFIVQERVFDDGLPVTTEQFAKLDKVRSDYGLDDLSYSEYYGTKHNFVVQRGEVKIFDIGVGNHNPNW